MKRYNEIALEQDNSSGYTALRAGAGVIDRSRLGRILLTGADRRSYLQGLLTNEIAALTAGTGCYAALLTAQGRMYRWVLTALPCGLLALLTAINPGYMQPLYVTTIGRVLLGVVAGMVCAWSLVIKRIVDIKV